MGRDPVTAALGGRRGVPVARRAVGRGRRGAHRGSRDRVGRAAGRSSESGSFGWRQPVAVAAVRRRAARCLVLGLGWWVGPASHGDLHRTAAVPVPTYMVDAMATRRCPRAGARAPGTPTVRYQVLAGDGLRLGDDSVLPSADAPRLAAVVADLLSQSRPGGCADAGRPGHRLRRPAVSRRARPPWPARRAGRPEPHLDGAVRALRVAGGPGRCHVRCRSARTRDSRGWLVAMLVVALGTGGRACCAGNPAPSPAGGGEPEMSWQTLPLRGRCRARRRRRR